jgi:zinc transport system ATP-binding protein
MLLLDEPAAGLDPKAAADMYALIMRLNTEGMTVIMVSHDNAAVGECASHILRLKGGQA